MDIITSDLKNISIMQQPDQHSQWQLPLMEMDKEFRNETYTRHYADTLSISSLGSKLGHFLTDNPMKYRANQGKDQLAKNSRIFEFVINYHKSLGRGFFSFATPSPDELVSIGCRRGFKGYYRPHLNTSISNSTN